MKLFLDSINLTEIKKYMDFGVIDGITTNPSLISKSTQSFDKTVKDICDITNGDVSIEVSANHWQEMIAEGNYILSIAPNIVIKLPMTWDGVRACRYFSSQEKKTNMTLCFSANQALIAAKVGATYISPFIGRLDDIGEDGIELISDIRTIYDNYNIKTQILAASVRSDDHIREVALHGADVATIPEKVMSNIITHSLTDKGLEKFNQDWMNSNMKIN